MRDAFGTQNNVRLFRGIIGGRRPADTAKAGKNAAHIQPGRCLCNSDSRRKRLTIAERGAHFKTDQAICAAAAESLRSSHAGHAGTGLKPPSTSWWKETKEGTQYRESSTRTAARCSRKASEGEPYERTRTIIIREARRSAEARRRTGFPLPGRHCRRSREAPPPGYGPWNLSADRANAVRQILQEEGMPSTSFYAIAGKADTDPLFPDDPFMAANRRVTITLMREAPPVPPGLQP